MPTLLGRWMGSIPVVGYKFRGRKMRTLIDKSTGIVCTIDDTTKKGLKEYKEKSASGEYDELFYYFEVA